jgi:hypothetical protein
MQRALLVAFAFLALLLLAPRDAAAHGIGVELVTTEKNALVNPDSERPVPVVFVDSGAAASPARLHVRLYDNDHPTYNVTMDTLLMHHGKMVHYALVRLDGAQFAHVHPADTAAYDAAEPLSFTYPLAPGFYMLGVSVYVNFTKVFVAAPALFEADEPPLQLADTKVTFEVRHATTPTPRLTAETQAVHCVTRRFVGDALVEPQLTSGTMPQAKTFSAAVSDTKAAPGVFISMEVNKGLKGAHLNDCTRVVFTVRSGGASAICYCEVRLCFLL